MTPTLPLELVPGKGHKYCILPLLVPYQLYFAVRCTKPLNLTAEPAGSRGLTLHWRYPPYMGGMTEMLCYRILYAAEEDQKNTVRITNSAAPERTLNLTGYVKIKALSTLVPEVFFCREETRQGRERSGERKPLVAGDATLTIMLR